MSHTALPYHIVISTYYRQNVINEEHERELYKFMHDYSKKKGIYVRRIGGMPDHVHILCDIPAKMAVAAYVQTLKTESCKFMRVNEHFPKWISWAEKYGAFTLGPTQREAKRQYIMNQKEHHRHISFTDEYRRLLDEAGLRDETEMLGDQAAPEA